MGVPIIRIIVFVDLSRGPCTLGNYYTGKAKEPLECTGCQYGRPVFGFFFEAARRALKSFNPPSPGSRDPRKAGD